MRRRDFAAGAAASLALALAPGRAPAHIAPGQRVRTMILAERDGALVAYLRSPAPLLFSDVIAGATAAGAPLASPFLYPEHTGAGVRYRLPAAALSARGGALRARLEGAFRWRQHGTEIPVTVTAVRVRSRDPGGGFDSPDAARASLAGPPPALDPVFAEAVIEAAFRLNAPDPRGPVALSPALPPLDLPPGVTVDNHMIDARPDAPGG